MVGASFKQMANIFSFNLLIGVFPAHVRYALVFENARNHSQELVTVVSDYHNIEKAEEGRRRQTSWVPITYLFWSKSLLCMTSRTTC
jgi:hypothetical protein